GPAAVGQHVDHHLDALHLGVAVERRVRHHAAAAGGDVHGIEGGVAAHVGVVDGVVGRVVVLQDLGDRLHAGRLLQDVAAPVVGVDEEVEVHVLRVGPLDDLLGPAPHAVGDEVGVLRGIVRVDGAVGGVVEGGDDDVVGDVHRLHLEADLGVVGDGNRRAQRLAGRVLAGVPGAAVAHQRRAHRAARAARATGAAAAAPGVAARAALVPAHAALVATRTARLAAGAARLAAGALATRAAAPRAH